MPASALMTAGIETALNRLLALDPDSQSRLKPLVGCRLFLFVKPFPFGLCLAFSEQIDVLYVAREASEIVRDLDKSMCCIQSDVSTLTRLSDTSELTQLIQSKKLNLDGSLHVAQHASELFKALHIDWEEILSQYTGDVAANQLVSGVKKGAAKVNEHVVKLREIFANALVEEKQLAAHKLAVMHFSDEVSALRDDVARFEARLRQFEVANKK